MVLNYGLITNFYWRQNTQKVYDLSREHGVIKVFSLTQLNINIIRARLSLIFLLIIILYQNSIYNIRRIFYFFNVGLKVY